MMKREEIEEEGEEWDADEQDEEQDDEVVDDFAQLLAGYRNIKGRLNHKSGPRQFKDDQGVEVNYFNFSLTDESNNSLRGVAFGKNYERLYPMLRRNKRYLLRDVNVRPADRQYTSDNLEFRITRDSQVEELLDRKNLRFNQLNRLTIGAKIDLIGALKEVDLADTVITRDGREVSRRQVTIVDQSCCSMKLTIWGHQAENFEGAPGDVIVTRDAHIVSYWGRSASATDTVFINPPLVPQVERLRSWYRIRRNEQAYTPLSNRENQPVENFSPPRQDMNLKMELDEDL